ncbi:SOS response regulatory protein OraA/RecX [Solirubrobacter pauli]|uniref:Regulatory protein RecX n=1 Tax=Solirubrobacter pauli TaxID=166793 RepID=A0A660L2C1_9ACTN|nr:regulatory protein RecX [Solirubrobacter pauli]RKQ87455.1 SOS response regulatory protein OraA/RecX [Solirubrobacter pauli]
MGSAAGPTGPATPQGDRSADTDQSPGAALPGLAAASRGGEPTSSADAKPSAPAAPANPVAASPAESAGPGADEPAGPAADGPDAPAADAAAGPAAAAPADSQLALDGLAAELAPESLGALAAEPPAISAEQRREEAFNAAWRFIARRERTEAEVRARLERNDVEAALVEEVLDELRTGGYVDDAGYAQRFAEDRRNLDGWGADRIERRLRELGVDRRHIAAALAAGDHDELAAATALLARRYPVPPEQPRDREKALGFLVRKGFDLELAHDALRRHAASAVEG